MGKSHGKQGVGASRSVSDEGTQWLDGCSQDSFDLCVLHGAQLYRYDPGAALQQRMNRNSNLRQHTMQSLQTMLTASHAYSAIYKQAYEILKDLGDCVRY
jgi:hypothetical protein